jgi:KH domain-containing protein
MKTFYIKSKRKILQNKRGLEDKLKVKINLSGDKIVVSGNETDEYFAEIVLRALDFPFLVQDALLLLDENYVFEVINIKDITKRKDLSIVKARIIGTKGKTLKVLCDLSNCFIELKDNQIAIIGKYEDIKFARQAVISIIQGSKQGNVYAYLEKSHNYKKRI